MKIVNKVLYISPHDLDHIMSYEVSDIPSESFKQGLKIELEMSGLEDEMYERIVIDIDRKSELLLHKMSFENGSIDMSLSGDPAKFFMLQLIDFFKQNGGKNFLTTTFEGMGEKYGITITNLKGNDSPAEKLQRFKSLLEKVLEYGEEGLCIDEGFANEIEKAINP
jgi:hypothetical protein